MSKPEPPEQTPPNDQKHWLAVINAAYAKAKMDGDNVGLVAVKLINELAGDVVETKRRNAELEEQLADALNYIKRLVVLAGGAEVQTAEAWGKDVIEQRLLLCDKLEAEREADASKDWPITDSW